MIGRENRGAVAGLALAGLVLIWAIIDNVWWYETVFLLFSVATAAMILNLYDPKDFGRRWEEIAILVMSMIAGVAILVRDRIDLLPVVLTWSGAVAFLVWLSHRLKPKPLGGSDS